jgi:RNA polymerase sigma-70 factor (ECF subfamily)
VAVDAVSFAAGHAAEAAVSDAAVREARAAVCLPFDDVYERHFDFAWRNLRRLGVPAPDVDDAAQEVFLVVHRRLPQFEPRGSLKAWLFGIVARVASAHRRRLRRAAPTSAGREEPIDPDRTPSLSPAGAEAMAESEAVAVLHALLDGLDDDKRAVFVLAELEQMTAPEIAEALGVKLNTVYGRLRQARREFDEGAARMRARDGWRLR